MDRVIDVVFIVLLVVAAGLLVCRCEHDPNIYKRAFLDGYDARMQYERGK